MSEEASSPPTSGRAERALVAVNSGVLIALMAAMALLVIANVIARYAFNHSFVWAEELSRYMMIWVGFLGSGLVLRIGAHLAVDVFQDLLPRRAAQAMRVVVVAVLAGAFVAMLWLGAQYVDFAWGQGSAGWNVPADNWSARFTTARQFESGTYRFVARVDDGVRIYVDGQLILNEWREQPYRTFVSDYAIGAGQHYISVEYMDVGDAAALQVYWERR